jgi:hypothetical protein
MPIITEQDIREQYQAYTGREPTRSEVDQHLGQEVPDIQAAAKQFFAPTPTTPTRSSGGGGTEFPVFEFPEFPGPSAEETKMLEVQTQLIQLQMEDLRRQNTLNATLFPLQSQLAAAQLKYATQVFPKQAAMIDQLIRDAQPSTASKEIARLSEERALAALRGEPLPLSAAQTAQLDTIYGEAQRQGTADLRQFAEEMAASRGMAITDSPIGDVSLREASNLFQGLQASRAQATLDMGQSQQAFGEGVRQFQEGLKQQALQNRLALASGAANQPTLSAVNAAPLIGSFQGSLATQAQSRASEAQYGLGQAQYGLGLAGLQFNQEQLMQQMNQANLDRISRERIAGMAYPGTALAGPNSTINNVATWAPVAAAGLTAAGQIFGPGGYSTARVKKDITPLDAAEFKAAVQAKGLPLDAYDDALTALRDTPITRWRYTWEPDDSLPHIGPILELSPPELSRDGLRVDLLDYAGLTHAGLKALDRQVQRLEAKVA